MVSMKDSVVLCCVVLFKLDLLVYCDATLSP